MTTGSSLRPLLEGNQFAPWRQSLVIESEFGKGVVTDAYKYIEYDEGANRFQLYDRINDPGELRNRVDDPECCEVVERLKKLL